MQRRAFISFKYSRLFSFAATDLSIVLGNHHLIEAVASLLHLYVGDQYPLHLVMYPESGKHHQVFQNIWYNLLCEIIHELKGRRVIVFTHSYEFIKALILGVNKGNYPNGFKNITSRIKFFRFERRTDGSVIEVPMSFDNVLTCMENNWEIR